MTANLLLDNEMHGLQPPCWNREARARVRIRHGVSEATGEPIAVEVRDDWSEAVCRTWEGTGIGPNNERYPEAHGWVSWCRSCRWRPAGVRL